MLNEIDNNIKIVSRVFHNNGEALKQLDVSLRSLLASLLIVIPLMLMQFYSKPINQDLFASLDPSLADLPQNSDFFDGFKMLLSWILWPIIAFIIVSLMDIKTHFIRYIIADNWASLLANGLVTVPFLLFQFGLPAMMASMMIIFLTLLKLTFKWRIAKSALETSNLNASLILFVDVAASMLFVNLVAEVFAS